eukprot:gene12044-7834_t
MDVVEEGTAKDVECEAGKFAKLNELLSRAKVYADFVEEEMRPHLDGHGGGA